MSNQEAIALLRNLEDSLDSYCELSEEGKTAFRMAIEALSSSEFPNSSDTDTISRQAAIDALCNDYCGGHQDCKYYPNCENLRSVQKLPSAQPEIIRCKDCKHWDGVDTCDVIDAPVWDNDFCSMAERRTDG